MAGLVGPAGGLGLRAGRGVGGEVNSGGRARVSSTILLVRFSGRDCLVRRWITSASPSASLRAGSEGHKAFDCSTGGSRVRSG